MDENLRAAVKLYLEDKGLPTDEAVTFEDVYLVGLKSEVDYRSQPLKTRLAGDIIMNIPLVSSNMSDVTESEMAIAIARKGGCGFIHQFAPIKKRVVEVMKVKKAESDVIDSPVKIGQDATLGAAKRLMDSENVSSVLVVDQDDKLAGILTARDIRFETDPDAPVAKLMTPLPLKVGPPDIGPEAAREFFKTTKLEKLPLIDAAGRLRGLITANDVLKNENAARDSRGRLIVGAAVGINQEKTLEEAAALLGAGADVIIIDTARAYATRVENLIHAFRQRYENTPLVVGNVDSAEGAFMLFKAGADTVKVGIGPGSACKTRVDTGAGAPQLTAIAECAAVARQLGGLVMADGGLETDGKLAKAFGVGAHSAMVGGRFAGVKESPGRVFHDGGEAFKFFVGSASLEAQAARIEFGDLDRVRASEGVPRRVKYKGELSQVIDVMLGHLRSSMAFANSRDLEEFRRLAKFRRQTKAGHEEGLPKS